MTLKLSLSKSARQDLKQIYRYTVQTWGEDQADNYLGQIQKALEAHAKNPFAFSRSEPRLAQLLELDEARSFKAGEHRCYFVFDEKELRILAVLHPARDKEKVFASLKKR